MEHNPSLGKPGICSVIQYQEEENGFINQIIKQQQECEQRCIDHILIQMQITPQEAYKLCEKHITEEGYDKYVFAYDGRRLGQIHLKPKIRTSGTDFPCWDYCVEFTPF